MGLRQQLRPQGSRRSTCQGVASLPDEVVRAWLEPLFGTAESARQFQRLITSLRARDLLAVEPALARLQVPTLIVWGTGDNFFRRRWAYRGACLRQPATSGAFGGRGSAAGEIAVPVAEGLGRES
jgi:pimeloyl-ACP methyl ester carboxylesterase